MWVIWASAACVNLRFVLFSAQWRPFLDHLPRGRRLALGYLLADLNLVMFQKAWPSGRREPGQARYAAGGAFTAGSSGNPRRCSGSWPRRRCRSSWGLGFAGTLSMLGIAYALLVDRSAWLAAVVVGDGRDRRVRAAAEAQHPGRDRRGGRRRPLLQQAGRAGRRDRLAPHAMSWEYGAVAILGLAAVTFVTRGLFLFSERELPFPAPLQRALQVAPLAAIVAVIAPEIFMTPGRADRHLARRPPGRRGGGDPRLRRAAGRAGPAAGRARRVPAVAAALGW